jgi:hypothetical protein
MRKIETRGAGKVSGAEDGETAPGSERRRGWLAALALVTLIALAPAAHAETLFDRLLGSWVGAGQIRYDDGQSEGIRCNGYYKGGGEKLQLAILCKSMTTEVEIRGQLTARGNNLIGTWEERTFNAAGDATGRVAGNKLSLTVVGGGFKGAMSVTSTGAKQVVTIAAEGIKMRSVNVTLAKS